MASTAFPRAHPQLESLEPRWTPATRVSATQLTYQDVDGDIATVTFSKPILTDISLANGMFVFHDGNVNNNNSIPQQLYEIDLTSIPGVKGTHITIEALGFGNGRANVGFINAAGKDLGKVTLDGDLGRIIAGDDTLSTPALKSLSARSIGMEGTTTQSPDGDLISQMNGAVGEIVIELDIDKATFNVTGDSKGDIGLVDIGRTLIGGDALGNGQITAGGTISKIHMGGSVLGGAGSHSGQIFAGEKFGDINILGSLLGSTGGDSGLIKTNGNIGDVLIGGSIIGGDSGGNPSGTLSTNGGKIKSLSVLGSISGGGGFLSGRVDARFGLGSLRIGSTTMANHLQGGAGTYSGSVESAEGSIGDIFIGGSIFSGTGNRSGSITAGGKLGNITVGSGIFGSPDDRVVIAAAGITNPGAARIGNISVGSGGVFRADILSGYDMTFVGADGRTDANAKIGVVSVGGDWVASSLVAGVDRGADGFFGTADDGATVAGSKKFISKIGAVTIADDLLGSAEAGDHFGFVAEKVTGLSVKGADLRLLAGALNDDVNFQDPADVSVRELEA